MKGWPTRPTTDIAKEALFNILTNRLDFETVRMLDLFGGTGNHSWEFLSRGCQDVTYVDMYPACIKFVTNQRELWGYTDEMTIEKQNVRSFIKGSRKSYDYIFAGPPYGLPWLDNIPEMIFTNDLLAEAGLFVLEHNRNHTFTDFSRFNEERKYGQTVFSFFS